MILDKDRITLASNLPGSTPGNNSCDHEHRMFPINENLPIGILVNGNLDFEGISFETLIGEFGKTVDFNEIKTIENVKNGFIEYLSLNTDFTPGDVYLKEVLDDFKNELLEGISECGFLKALDYYKEKEVSADLKSYKNFSKEFFDIIPEDMDKEKYNLEIWKIFSYYLFSKGTSMIFAGYDIENIYPSYFEINLYCNDCGRIIYEEVDSKINCKDPIIKVLQ